MSTLADRGHRAATAADGGEPTPYPVVAGLLAAAQAAAAGLVGVLVPVVAAWLVSAGGGASWQQVVRLSLTLWLLAQHAGVAVPGGEVSISPLGLTLVPVAACWFAGRRMARSLDPAAERTAAGLGRAVPALPHRSALLAYVAGYATIAVAGARIAASALARPLPLQAAVAAAGVCALAGGAGVAAHRFGGLRSGLRGVALAGRLPGRSARWLRPGLVALTVHLGAAAVVLVVALIAGRDQVLALHRALDPGMLGGLVLTAGQLALIPNLALWVAAVLAGPGFAVGTGTSVTLTGSVLGPLPAVPVLGALPAPGSMPSWAVVLAAVPVAAGVAAALVVLRRTPAPRQQPATGGTRDGDLRNEPAGQHRHQPSGQARPEPSGQHGRGPGGRRRSVAVDVAGASLVAGVGFTALAWAAGGAAGPGRMAVIGPSPVLSGLVLAAEVGAGGALTLLLGWVTPAAVAAARDHRPRR